MKNIIEVITGISVCLANIPCPVKGKKIINGAKVVRAPKIKPVK